jgi:DNA-binding transcriptional ArsR family regulator
VRVLISTFGGDDYAKVLSAMKSLPYEKLVLVGEASAEDTEGFHKLMHMEEMSGHCLDFKPVDTSGFMETVEEICDVLIRCSKDPESGYPNLVALNISGGSKLLGDAALFSAFRLGIEAYHCDERVTKLPVLNGAIAVDRFTVSQVKFIMSIKEDGMLFDELLQALQPAGRQAAERILRTLRKEGLVKAELRSGKVHVALSAEGREVARTIGAARTDHAAGADR